MKSNATHPRLLIQSNLFLLLLTSFLLFSGTISHAQTVTVYVYEVEVSDVFKDKDLLDLVAPINNFSHRQLTDNGFKFSSLFPVSVDEIADSFSLNSIPHGEIKASKEQVTLIAADKAGGKDCELAQILCSSSSQSANSNGQGKDELNSSNRGCLNGGEHQSSWYYINILTPGILTFEIDPQDNNDDYDFAVWGPFNSVTANANCPPVSPPTRCNYSSAKGNTGLSVTATNDSQGQTGSKYSNDLTVLTGQIYILLVDNYSNSGDPYNLSFGSTLGSAVLGCLPVVLPVELSSFKAVKTAEGNLLKWTTESEHNSEEFKVQWTENPSYDNWVTVSEIKAAGNSEHRLDYSALHRNPGKVTNYYRLVQTDSDATDHVYSDRIVALDNSGNFDQPVRIVNLLGQEVNAETPGMLIYQFEDGTSLKIFR